MCNAEEIHEPLTIGQPDSDTFFLSGEVNDGAFQSISSWILKQNKDGKSKELTLIINSVGGSVYSGFGIIDMMLGSKIPINTVAIGCAASMGFLIFISGKNRISTPNTTFLSHQYSSLYGGKYHELLANRKDQDFLAERFVEMYKKFCRKKITDKKIREELLGKSDCYLTPKEVLDLGFCDEIKFLN